MEMGAALAGRVATPTQCFFCEFSEISLQFVATTQRKRVDFLFVCTFLYFLCSFFRLFGLLRQFSLHPSHTCGECVTLAIFCPATAMKICSCFTFTAHALGIRRTEFRVPCNGREGAARNSQ